MEQDETPLDKLYRQYLTANMISRSANTISKLVELKNKLKKPIQDINVNVSDEELLKMLLNCAKTISYWEQRCLLAEKLVASMNEKIYSITIMEDEVLYLERLEAYNKFIEENKEP